MKPGKILFALYFVAMSALPFGHLVAQPNSKTTLEEAKKAIEESNAVYFQAFVKNDSSIFINRYADDCWIMPPNTPTQSGPTAAANFFQKAYSVLKVRNGKFITIDVLGISEDTVAEIGFFKLYNAAGEEFDNGKFLVLWKKTVKGWKMWRDSFSSDRPKSK